MNSSRCQVATIVSLLVLGTFSGCCVHRWDVGQASLDPLMAEHTCAGCGSHAGKFGHGGPFSSLRASLTCGSGCGEWYFDEWLSDPPECCDPCDAHGQWIGPQGCCKGNGRPFHKKNLWGVRMQGHHGRTLGGYGDYDAAYERPWVDGDGVIIDERWSDEAIEPEEQAEPVPATPAARTI
jgi:hypothetical protein